MGMFDSIAIKMKCPYCGKESLIEAQTKQLTCSLFRWVKGEYVTKAVDHLDCMADCMQKECFEYTESRLGYYSGFGRMFTVRVFLEEGRVTGEYEILKAED